MNLDTGATLIALFVMGLFLSAPAEEKMRWDEVVGRPQATIPEAPFDSVSWRSDFLAATNEAKQTGAPLLVTFRCLPCKQCAAFDKNVLEGSTRLTPLLRQFVTVRITDAAQLDQRFFPFRTHQDLDLSWWAYLLGSEGQLYGVFGGKDHVSDATRISEAAFVNTLQRVLDHHYDPRREQWKVDGPKPDLIAQAQPPKEISSYNKFADEKPWMKKQDCMHCHQVGDLLHFDEMEKDTFRIEQLSQPWPLPENVGIELDRDHGLLVTKVEAGSAAQKAGIRKGDELAVADKTKLFGQADFRGVLHRASFDKADLSMMWKRGGELLSGKLDMPAGWKETDNRWRKTVYDGIYGPRFGFFPIKGPNQGKGSMSFKPFLGKNAEQNSVWKAGVRPNMEIIEVNGRSDDWDSRELLGWFRLNHKVGDEVTLKVRQNGKEQTIRYQLLDKYRPD